MTQLRVETDRLRVHVVLDCAEGEDPEEKARDICFEQTVELPPSCVGPETTDAVVGRVEKIAGIRPDRYLAVLSYPLLPLGDEIPQLLNVLFGNISLQTGIRLVEVEWPAELLDRFAGPRHGIDGLRQLCHAPKRRALLCAALKPVGSSSSELARICFDFARGGMDIVKDDHGLADQATSPFRERITCCQQAVTRANSDSGGHCLYFPNVTGPADTLEERVELARDAGCRGVMLAPLLAGPDTVRWVGERYGLAVLAHPALAGAYLGERHGIAAELLLGDLFRLLGSDGVIYPNVGGRFPFSESTCVAINERLRRPLGKLRPAFPVPGGGIDVKRAAHWIECYGTDTILLIGGSLYAHEDRVEAARRLRAAVDAAS